MIFMLRHFSGAGHIKSPLSSVRLSVPHCFRPSEIFYPQLPLNYTLDCHKTWPDCSLRREYVHWKFIGGFLVGGGVP